jgi:hypothetical protein
VTPAKKVKDRKTGIERIWKRIQRLGEPEAAQSSQDQSAKAEQPEATRGKKSAGLPKRVYIPGHGWASTVKAAPKAKKVAKKGAKAQAASAPRDGSKTAQVVAMLQRKNGATLSEIMDKMGWQKHTVRGFMAGAMKKAGYTVESFKPEGGERTYRITK